MSDQNKNQPDLLFNKGNYRLLLIGLAIIIIGFILMSGGASPDPHVFDENEVYGFRRRTLAPIVVIVGFVIEIFAIMKKPRQ